MKTSITHTSSRIVEPPFFSNWVDLVMPRIANSILPFVSKIPGITPNIITWFSFLAYTAGSLLIFLPLPQHLLYTAFLLPLSYIADCLDGQLARFKHKGTPLGNYFDKVLDVLKIFILTISLGYALYLQTENIVYIFLGFTACFFFNFRYYLKHETMYYAYEKDHSYLEKARAKRYELYEEFKSLYKKWWQEGIVGKMKVIIHINRAIVAVDEGEFVIFTSIAAIFNRLDILLWVLAISQLYMGIWRFIERGYQTKTMAPSLLWPMRK